MKKLVSLLLTVCMCLSVGVMLTACGDEEHTHTYKTEWSKDTTHHWHACEGEDCIEAFDKAEHTWNDGEITTEATADADGVKTFTCTVCGQTKTESVEYVAVTTVDSEGWDRLFEYNNYTIYATNNADEESENAILKATGSVIYQCYNYRDGTKSASCRTNNDTSVRNIVIDFQGQYTSFTYDESLKAYVYVTEDRVGTAKYVIYAENEMIVKLELWYDETWFFYDFSDYGTTVITETAE